MEAFGEAVATADEDALKEMLGANFRELIPPVGTDDRYRFLEAWARSHASRATTARWLGSPPAPTAGHCRFRS